MRVYRVSPTLTSYIHYTCACTHADHTYTAHTTQQTHTYTHTHTHTQLPIILGVLFLGYAAAFTVSKLLKSFSKEYVIVVLVLLFGVGVGVRVGLGAGVGVIG